MENFEDKRRLLIGRIHWPSMVKVTPRVAKSIQCRLNLLTFRYKQNRLNLPFVWLKEPLTVHCVTQKQTKCTYSRWQFHSFETVSYRLYTQCSVSKKLKPNEGQREIHIMNNKRYIITSSNRTFIPNVNLIHKQIYIYGIS